MKGLAIVLGVIALLSMAVNSQAFATGPTWNFHEYLTKGGHVTVHGTINCTAVEPALFDGDVSYCNTISGWVPPWCNDYRLVTWWENYICQNKDTFKVAVPYWSGGSWYLENLYNWLRSYLPVGGFSTACPTIGDSTGTYQYIYVVVRLDQWLANPQPLQDEYTITNGTCAQLPGFLVGTTPIVFTPSQPQPFTTTPFTGTLWRDGDVRFGNPAPNPALTDWGVIALVLALAGIAVVFVLRRRARVAA